MTSCMRKVAHMFMIRYQTEEILFFTSTSPRLISYRELTDVLPLYSTCSPSIYIDSITQDMHILLLRPGQGSKPRNRMVGSVAEAIHNESRA